MKRLSLLSLLSIALFFTGCAFVNMSLLPSGKGMREKVIEGSGAKKILLMELTGTITGQEESDGFGFGSRPSPIVRIKESLQKAEKDDRIAGVILKINSPGGSATASDIIYHELKSFRERTGIPIYSSIFDLGASGGYYAAIGTDRIYAHPTAIVGSISVLTMTFNLEGLLAKVGIEEETIKSGEKKDIGSPFRPITPEEREIFQTIVDRLHERFVGLVYEHRKDNLSRSDVERLADGRIFTAGEALEEELIDGVGYLDDTIGLMKESLGLREARIVTYQRGGREESTVYSQGPSDTPSVINLIGLNITNLDRFEGVRFMYLWKP
jgi:protease-4